jgi:hypothetical protein
MATLVPAGWGEERSRSRSQPNSTERVPDRGRDPVLADEADVANPVALATMVMAGFIGIAINLERCGF